jgi:hypothetical protein
MKLGKPLPPVKEIIQPSQEELDKVNARWDAFAPLFYKGLLDAQNITTKNPTARFLYDKRKMRYIHRKTGRVITLHEIRQAYIAYSRKLAGR